MSHYRDRREKIRAIQSKSLENLPSKTATGQPSGQKDSSLTQTQSTHRLRDTSPRWKEHYKELSEKWSSGQSMEKEESAQVWDAVRKDRARGGYPWTHLSHPQDEEVWLNPEKLPDNIGSNGNDRHAPTVLENISEEEQTGQDLHTVNCR